MDSPSPTAAFVAGQDGAVEISSESKGNIFFAFAALPVAIMGKPRLAITPPFSGHLHFLAMQAASSCS
jgi:hypothetical protein